MQKFQSWFNTHKEYIDCYCYGVAIGATVSLIGKLLVKALKH